MTNHLSKHCKLRRPSFRVATISMDRVHEIDNFVSNCDLCSSTFATSTAIDTDNFLERFKREREKKKSKFVVLAKSICWYVPAIDADVDAPSHACEVSSNFACKNRKRKTNQFSSAFLSEWNSCNCTHFYNKFKSTSRACIAWDTEFTFFPMWMGKWYREGRSAQPKYVNIVHKYKTTV